MSQQDLFEQALASLHEAALDDAVWPATSALLDEACGAVGNAVFVSAGLGADARVLFGELYYRGQRHQELEREYMELHHPWDERVPRVRRLPDSKLVHIPVVYTEQELKTSPTYNEALLRSKGQNGLHVRLDGPDGSRFVWTIYDPAQPGGWGSVQINMIEGLVPHLRQFVRVRQALASAEAEAVAVNHLLDNSRIGVVQLDRQRRIMAANNRARSTLRRSDGLSNRGGLLRARLPKDNARLEQLLAQALPPFGGQGAGGSMSVRRAPGLLPLTLHVNLVSVRQMDFGVHRVAALVLIVEPISQGHIDPGPHTDGKPGSSRIGGRQQRVRHCRGNGPEGHIHQIHRKHGISRQSDLVRLVLSSLDGNLGPRG